ncbi:MDR family MFS transporter [Egibacter rhizosphaerae]|nr:MDR family MFS transporter [Egibacter rhizosphaerae]
MASAEPPEHGPATTAGGRSPWVVMGAVLLGTYLVVINTTVLGVALPHIDRELGGTAPIDVDWVVTTYLLAVVLVQPATGWLGDRFGRRSVYLVALLMFGVGSIVGALAPTMPLLLGGRVLQGLGGGALMPIGMAIVYGLFPAHKRGQALGIWGMALMAAPTLGPPFGGWMVTAASWRWVFAALVVISAIGLLVAWRVLPTATRTDPRPLDIGGWVLAGLAMPAIVLLARNAQSWGFASVETFALAALCVVLLAVLVGRSLRRANPLIELRAYTVPTFAAGSVVLILVTMTQFATINYLPVELQVVRGLSAQTVGLLIVPNALAAAAMMPLAGRLADRVGSRLPVSVGHALGGASLVGLGLLSPETPIEIVVALMAVMGMSNGLSLMPTTVAAMNSLPERFTGQASALLSLTRQLAGAIGVAVFAGVLVAALGSVAPAGVDTAEAAADAQSGYNLVFLIAAGLRLAASVVSLALPGRRRMAELQNARAAEAS